MEINQTETIVYERPVDETAPESAERTEATLPTILRAAALLFSLNVLILSGIWLTPELRVGVYGAEDQQVTSFYKPSPFTEVVDTARPRKVRAAAKVRPVLYQEPEPSGYTEAADLFLPESTQTSASSQTGAVSATAHKGSFVTGNTVDQIVDGSSDFPRVTASLNRATAERAVHSATVEIAPRRVSVN